MKKSIAFPLTMIILLLMAVQSFIGLFFPCVYNDSAVVIASYQGNDLITLFVAVPILALTLIFARRGSRRAAYIWVSMLCYAFYNYLFYMFGAVLNDLFLVYIAAFTLSVIALIVAIRDFGFNDVSNDFTPSGLFKFISAFLMIFGLIIGGMWLAQWINFLVTGEPPVIPGMTEGYKLVATVDFSTQVPALIIASVLLWKNKPSGFILGSILTIANTVYLLVLLAFCPFASRAGVQEAWGGFPLFGSLFVASLVSSVILLNKLKPHRL